MSPKFNLEKNRIGLRLKLLLVVVLAMLMMWAMLVLFLVKPDWLDLSAFKSSSLLLAALATGLLMALLVWLFDAVFLLRLERLSADVARVADAGDRSSRVKTLSGKDELTGLAQGINSMLSSLEEAQYALQLEKDRAQLTLESIADAVITSNSQGQVLSMNAVAERLCGINFNQLSDKRLAALFHLKTEDKQTDVDSAWLTDPYSALEEVMLQRADGLAYVIRKSASPLYDRDGQTFGIVTVLHDVTLLRNLSKQLTFQAKHDALTGLMNRYEFDQKVQLAIGEVHQTGRTQHCIAYLDLDRFKLVNDSCGHLAGDMLLQQLAGQLKAKVRSSDALARLGGDEFALLLVGCDLAKAQQIVADILNTVSEYRFSFDDKVFKVGASIGLAAISAAQSANLSEVLAAADAACYAAKEQGGNRIQVYRADDKQIHQHNNQLQWVSRIHLALEQHQFVLYAQALKSLKPNGEPHLELLIRLQGVDGVLYPPSYFLPVAERYHLMPKIDRWVVSEAFRIMLAKGPHFKTLCAINLSGLSLSDAAFLSYVVAEIHRYKVNPRQLCFEITETAVITNLDRSRHFIQTLRDMGCRFSLDDFGSGLASFAYLKNLQVDFLKIDGLFIKGIASNAIDKAMVESINHVGQMMGLTTIAEFVEDEATLATVKAIGIDYAQGYAVAEPALFDDSYFIASRDLD
jgi:diguanylate cyclase (GGDEF)-like protein/PAS domain S-box-containing protein